MSDDKSQEATAPEQKPIDVAEFRGMTKEATLREYEINNRNRILAAPLEIRESFNEKWKKVTGNYYWLPVTQVPTPQAQGEEAERIDPEGQGYKGYWEVVFSPRGSKNDPEDVTLAVNGQCLQMERGKKVIMPGPFLECADHALYPVYKQLPGFDRKITGWVKHFPYTVIRKATKAEYEERKRLGDKMTKEARDAEERAAVK